MRLLEIRSKGQTLIIVLVVMSALLAAGTILLKAVFSERMMTELYIQKEKAFYLAEAGLEDAKSILAKNPFWFTDNPHLPADDAGWIINGAKGSVKQFGEGDYKIVRESGKNIIYSLGSYKNGRSVVRVKYDTGKAKEFRIL